MWVKNNQNIFDLVGNLENLKDFLRENKGLKLDTSFLKRGQKVSSNANFSNAFVDPEDLKCANDCWLCDGTWSAERYWYADCVWNA